MGYDLPTQFFDLFLGRFRYVGSGPVMKKVLLRLSRPLFQKSLLEFQELDGVSDSGECLRRP